MLKIGLAQEIITPAVGVGLAGYINKRPNEGMYDDLYVKTVIFQANDTCCGIVSLDHICPSNNFIEIVKEKIEEKLGVEFFQNLIICATHTHTGPEYRKTFEEMDEATLFSFHNMIDAVVAGALTLEKLEAMTCVCSVGLDMIAIPGDTKATTISGIIADELAIGMINQKTTAVRIIPVIGKGVGETVEFGGLLGYAPIMPVNQFSCDAFVSRGGRIPAPIHSFKN